MQIGGVDGCQGGWIAAIYDAVSEQLTLRCYGSFTDVIAAHPDAACITIDIPIGLTEGPARECDVDARRRLGQPRGSSVFPAPPRPLLQAETYHEANALSKSTFSKGISQQAFGIYRKTREVDEVMTPALQEQVREIHPELSFWSLAARQPMQYPKRTPAGFDERADLLRSVFGAVVPGSRTEARHMSRQAGCDAEPDDVLDAMAASATAIRVVRGEAATLPEHPSTDSRGLRMEMVF